VFIEPQQRICVPIAHGEGKIVVKNAEALQKLKNEGFIAYKYVDETARKAPTRSTRTARLNPSPA